MPVAKRVVLAIALCALTAGSLYADTPNTTPTPEELKARQGLGQRISGQIVWESNRTGQWELYTMGADGSNARRITSLGAQAGGRAYTSYLRPRFSTDGTTILFAYGKKHAPTEVWIIGAQGQNPRKLTVGNPLNWSADGKIIFFVRDSQLWAYEMASGREAKVHSAKLPADGRSGGMVGALRSDGKSVVMRTPRRNEYFILDQAKTVKTMGGCEPGFTVDGRYLYWVQGPKDFRVWDMQTNTEGKLLGTPDSAPYNYTYFPTVSRDGGWLTYGASPGQHSHDTSDYEVYIHRLANYKAVGKPVRLTFNKGTDRWPNLFLGAGAAQKAPEAPFDIFLFASEDAGPEYGGESGLWPQVDGCRAEATFMPGQDAEGGKGGSMRIDYDIRGEPKSFSLWTTPQFDTVNLSGYDRMAIYARGTTPTFTLVVKDTSAGDPDAPEGIADALVSGVGSSWRRFEVPFASFKPRKAGAKVRWDAINHIGIALIQPQNAPRGRLQVDNLRAVPKGVTSNPRVPTKVATGPGIQAEYTFKSGLDDTADAGTGGPLAPGKGAAPQVGEGRLSFRSAGIVSSAQPATKLTTACRRTGEITIEAWLRPANTSQSGPARIITLSADTGQRNFTLGQDGKRYIVRLRTTKTSVNGIPSLDGPVGSASTDHAYVVYTRDAAGRARLYVNAQQAAAADVPGDLSKWDGKYRLALGNELTNDRPWLGDMYYVAIHNTALSAAQIQERHKSLRGSLELPPDARAMLPRGRIVWETRRNGNWQLWAMDLDGENKNPLTPKDKVSTEASFSADGHRLLFTRGEAGNRSSVWVMDSDGGDPRKLINDASTPRWRKGESAVQFLRRPNRGKKFWQTWEYDLASGQERLLFPREGVSYKPELWSATGNDAGTRFVAWSPRPRGTWVLSADGKVQAHVHGGCEGTVAADQRFGYGVKTAGQFIRFNTSDGGDSLVFNKREGEWSHTYFPCVSRDGKWLVYGACPPNQHDHDTSDYEIFIVRLDNWSTVGEPIRLTFDKSTDRMPTVYVAPGK